VEFGDVFTIRLLTARPTVVAAAPVLVPRHGPLARVPMRNRPKEFEMNVAERQLAVVVAGSPKNKIQTAAAGVIPDSTKAETRRKMAEPGSDE
jgi:hypothetical protein